MHLFTGIGFARIVRAFLSQIYLSDMEPKIYHNRINGKPLEFGNKHQATMIEQLRSQEMIADDYSRSNAARKNSGREPGRKMNLENVRWECPLCGVMNFARTFVYSKAYVLVDNGWDDDEYIHNHEFEENDDREPFQPIITPRISFCHNSKCGGRRFYWRNSRNELFARYLGKYEDINELDFRCEHDPMKFYLELLTRPAPNQTNLF